MREPQLCETCGSITERDARNRCRPCCARVERDRAFTRAWRKRAWRAANPDKQRAEDRRKNYGLDAAGFDALFAAQHGVCLICRVSDATSVDHCHATGRIRGILCRACNAGLGLLRDDPALVRAAAAYLERN